jgi:hypothetical protein
MKPNISTPIIDSRLAPGSPSLSDATFFHTTSPSGMEYSEMTTVSQRGRTETLRLSIHIAGFRVSRRGFTQL